MATSKKTTAKTKRPTKSVTKSAAAKSSSAKTASARTTKARARKTPAKVVAAPVKSTTTQSDPKSLRKWNMIAAALLFGQAIAIAALSGSAGTRSIVANYLTLDTLQTKAAGHAVYAQGTHRLFDLNLVYVVIAFLMAGTLAHLAAATWHRRHYENDLGRNRNALRWVAAAVSGSLVLGAVALVTGVVDLASLLMLAALTVITALFSHLLEVTKRRTADGESLKRWVINTIAIAAGLVPWLVIGMYVKDSIVFGSGLPQYIYWLDGSAFILFMALAVNLFLSGRGKGRWSSYLFSERVCIAIAVVLSSAVAWQLFAGILR